MCSPQKGTILFTEDQTNFSKPHGQTPLNINKMQIINLLTALLILLFTPVTLAKDWTASCILAGLVDNTHLNFLFFLAKSGFARKGEVANVSLGC
jgi:hypothetical protein